MANLNKNGKRALLAAVGGTLLGIPLAANAATVNWLGGASGATTDFSNGGNWVGGSVPTQYVFPDSSVTVFAGFDGSQSGIANKTPTLTADYGLYGIAFQDSDWALNTGSFALSLSYKPNQAGSHSITSNATSGINTITGSLKFGNKDNNYWGDIYVASGGTLRLNATIANIVDKVSGNTAGGLSIVGPGTVELNTNGTLGTSGLRISNGTVNLYNTIGGGTTAGTGGLGTGNGRALTITGGKLDIKGAANLAPSTLALTGGELTNSSGTLVSVTTKANGSSQILAGLISGNLSMIYGNNASEITTINHANTYTGATTILSSGGGGKTNTVQASVDALSGQNGAFGNSTSAITLGSNSQKAALLTNGTVEIGRDITVGSGAGTVILGVSTTQVGASKYSGTINIGTGSGAQTLTLNSSSTASVDFAGNIVENATGAGVGSVTKTGDGIVKLSGANTYAGGTSVTAGTLLVNGTTAAASSFSVGGDSTSNTPTLGGGIGTGTLLNPNSANRSYYTASNTVGNIQGAVTINGAGTGLAGHLAAGNSVGTLQAGALTLSSGSITDVEFNGTANDFTSVAGGLAIATGGNVGINLYNENATSQFATVGLYNLFGYGSLTNTFDASKFSILNPNALYSYTFANDSADKLITLKIATVPEPTTLGLFGVGMMGLLARRRRTAGSV